MKTLPCLLRRAAVLAGAAIGLWLGACAARAAAAPAAPLPELTPMQSVFVSDPAAPGFGRDPFFPASKRNGPWAPPEPKKVVTPPVTPPPVTPPVTPPDRVTPPPPTPPTPRFVPTFTLSGIGGVKTAIINNVSFLKGESGTVTTPQGEFRIRLDEIKPGVVTITYWLEENKPEQLTLRLGGQ